MPPKEVYGKRIGLEGKEEEFYEFGKARLLERWQLGAMVNLMQSEKQDVQAKRGSGREKSAARIPPTSLTFHF